MTKRGRRKMETVREHETGTEIVLYLWTESLEWEAVVGVHSWKNSSGQKAIQAAVEWVRANMHPAYKPVIEVEELDPFASTSGCFVGFEVDRYWAAMLSDGECRKVDWDRYDPEDPEGASRNLIWHDSGMRRIPLNDLPCIDGGRTKTYYLDYTPDLWQGLQTLLDAIMAVRKHLNDLLAHDHDALISGTGIFALPERTDE